MKIKILYALLAVSLLAVSATAQRVNEITLDPSLRGFARVDPTTLAAGFELPLISYPGRGSGISVALRYSSDVWRREQVGSHPVPDAPGGCVPISEARFSEKSASGWTTSLEIPYVEYVGLGTQYRADGKQIGPDSSGCEQPGPDLAWVRRILIHLPSGRAHELRMDDEVLVFPRSSQCEDSETQAQCSSSDPSLPRNTSGWYYAIDGSNIRYFEDREADVYFAQLPDGTRYDFSPSLRNDRSPAVRTAIVRTDRNGNMMIFHDATVEFPNGRWTDTAGRSIPVPFSPKAPESPGDRTVVFPSMDDRVSRFVFRWKRLKGETPADSALDDFAVGLKFTGDKFAVNGTWETRNETSLFRSAHGSWVTGPDQVFNPVLLAEIELPSGAKYTFKYNNFGELVRVDLPTGGFEAFEMGATGVASEGEPGGRGVVKHLVSTGEGTEGAWNYSVRAVDAATFRSETLNPDGARLVRIVKRGIDSPPFGFRDPLAGKVIEEYAYSSSGRLAANRMTSWTKSEVNTWFGTVGRNPRIAAIDSVFLDRFGSRTSGVERFAYVNEDSLAMRDRPLLLQTVSATGTVNGVATTRLIEFGYVGEDPTIPEEDRAAYRVAGLSGLIGTVCVRDGDGTVISKAVNRYDDPDSAPRGLRGNRTSFESWDNSLGSHDDERSYVRSSFRFDSYGNVIEAADVIRTTRTVFDEQTHSLPVRVMSYGGDSRDSSKASMTESRFDPVSGLVLWLRHADGRESKFQYEPETRRLAKSTTFDPEHGSETSARTFYRDSPGHFQISRRTQTDEGHWSETTAIFDGLGRKVRNQESSPAGSAFVDTEFDVAARVARVSNPYRTGDRIEWKTIVYDETGRVVGIILPNGKSVPIDRGVLMGDLSHTEWGVIMGDLSRTEWGVIMGDLTKTDWGVLMGDLTRTDWGVLVGDLSRTEWGVIFGDLTRPDWGVIMGDLTRTDWGVLVGDLTGQ